MKKLLKSDTLFCAICLVALGVAYVVIRYDLFYLDGTSDYCSFLAKCGVVVILFGLIAKSKIIMGGVVIGYILGFAVGIMSKPMLAHPSGDSHPSHYGIWTIVYFAAVALSMVAPVIIRKIKRGNKPLKRGVVIIKK